MPRCTVNLAASAPRSRRHSFNSEGRASPGWRSTTAAGSDCGARRRNCARWPPRPRARRPGGRDAAGRRGAGGRRSPERQPARVSRVRVDEQKQRERLDRHAGRDSRVRVAMASGDRAPRPAVRARDARRPARRSHRVADRGAALAVMLIVTPRAAALDPRAARRTGPAEVAASVADSGLPAVRPGRVSAVPAGELLRVRASRGSSLAAVAARAEQLAVCLKLREIRVARDADNASRGTVTLVRRDPLADGDPAVAARPRRAAVALGRDPARRRRTRRDRPRPPARAQRPPRWRAGRRQVGRAVDVRRDRRARPRPKLWLLDGKLVELSAWEPVAERLAGPDADEAIELLVPCSAEMEDRYRDLLARGARKISASDGLPLHLIAVRRAGLLPHRRDRKKQTRVLRAAARHRRPRPRGRRDRRAATQKPGADVVPSALRDLFGFRLAMRCNTPQASDTILGQGWASSGFYAATISPVTAASDCCSPRTASLSGCALLPQRPRTSTRSRGTPAASGQRATDEPEPLDPRSRSPPELVERRHRAGRPAAVLALIEALLRLRAAGAAEGPIEGGCGTRAGAEGVGLSETQAEPDGVLRKACGNRRERLPPVRGRVPRRRVPLVPAGYEAARASRTRSRITRPCSSRCTAPSSGSCTRSAGRGGRGPPCRPRGATVCPHGRPPPARRARRGRSAPRRPALRGVLRPRAATVWSLNVAERAVAANHDLPAARARFSGRPHAEARGELVRCSYVKVAEYQRRGLVHLHAFLRLDGAMPKYRAHELHRHAGSLQRRSCSSARSARPSRPSTGAVAGEGWGGGPRSRWGERAGRPPASTTAREARDLARISQLPRQVRDQEHRTGRRRPSSGPTSNTRSTGCPVRDHVRAYMRGRPSLLAERPRRSPIRERFRLRPRTRSATAATA